MSTGTTTAENLARSRLVNMLSPAPHGKTIVVTAPVFEGKGMQIRLERQDVAQFIERLNELYSRFDIGEPKDDSPTFNIEGDGGDVTLTYRYPPSRFGGEDDQRAQVFLSIPQARALANAVRAAKVGPVSRTRKRERAGAPGAPQAPVARKRQRIKT